MSIRGSLGKIALEPTQFNFLSRATPAQRSWKFTKFVFYFCVISMIVTSMQIGSPKMIQHLIYGTSASMSAFLISMFLEMNNNIAQPGEVREDNPMGNPLYPNLNRSDMDSNYGKKDSVASLRKQIIEHDTGTLHLHPIQSLQDANRVSFGNPREMCSQPEFWRKSTLHEGVPPEKIYE